MSLINTKCISFASRLCMLSLRSGHHSKHEKAYLDPELQKLEKANLN